MVAKAKKVAEKLIAEKIYTKVINLRFVKPIDENKIIQYLKESKLCITIEDGTIIGGIGSSIKELMVENNITDLKIKSFAYPDNFIEHGSIEELEKKYKMDVESICEYIKNTN